MTRDEARIRAKEQLKPYLEAKGINTSKNFRCLAPGHEDKHPSMGYKDNRVKCFGCGKGGDIFDVISWETGIQDDRELFDYTYKLLGLEIDDNQKGKGGGNRKRSNFEQLPSVTTEAPPPANQALSFEPPLAKPEPEIIEEDLSQQFKLWANNLQYTDYLKRRGISQETAERFNVGFEPNFRENTGGKTWQALIIPTGKGSYVARNTDPNASAKNRYRKHAKSSCFNLKALSEATQPIHIVEGEIDALAVIEGGGEAIALGSTSNVHSFLNAVKSAMNQAEEENRRMRQKQSIFKEWKVGVEQPLIISLDNDKEGRKASEALAEGLRTLGVAYCEASPPKGYKDHAEALQANREAYIKHLNDVREWASKSEHLDSYVKNNSAAFELQSFIDDIAASAKGNYFPTGFNQVDKILDGGLYAGLYCIGAVSSLGKTTWMLQVADQIAQAGHDVLFFSLEMDANEVKSKSISRETLLGELRQGRSRDELLGSTAMTTRGIMTGKRYKHYSEAQKQAIKDAITAYAGYAKNIYFKVGLGNTDYTAIRQCVDEHIARTGRAPVVFIDYLQILKSPDVRMNDKQAVDANVIQLKLLSRDFGIPVVAISSFNRDNYVNPVSYASFKESGAIEYSSDVLIGLQYKGLDWIDNEGDKTRRRRLADERKEREENISKGGYAEIQLKVLKNRNGGKGEALFRYYPMFNYFEETIAKDVFEQPTTASSLMSAYLKDRK